MALTLANLRYFTQYVVGDPQLSTFSSQMYQDAINYAIKDYAKKTEATYIEATVTPDANGFCAIPSRYIRIKRVSHLTGGTTLTQLVESTMSFESMKSEVWQAATGTPKRWVLWSGEKVKITPIPSPAYSATIGYIEDPADLTTDAATVDTRIPLVHNEYLKYAASAWLLMLDGDSQDVPKAFALMNVFNQMIGYSDAVLDAKVQTTRNEGRREM